MEVCQFPVQTFGEKLRWLRKQNNMTLQKLANVLSTSTGYISDLESGRRQPSLLLARQIADYFGVSVDDLARDELELSPFHQKR